MSAADFDDIFGDDVKMDATAAPTLTNVNLDDDELFGGDATSSKVTKPATEQQGEGANWEHIGSREQDDFLSWLDDGGSKSVPATEASIPEKPTSPMDIAPPPAPVAPAPVAPTSTSTFHNVSLDDNDDFDRMLETGNTQPEATTVSANALNDDDDLDRMLNASSAQATSEVSAPPANVGMQATSQDESDDLDRMLAGADAQANFDVPPPADDTVGSISLDDDDDLEKIVQNAGKHSGASIFVPAPSAVGNISLDDDDDDDLERIVQKANKQANASGSRENSSSSLQIKSQVQAQHKAQQIDVAAVRQAFLETGELPAGSRLAVWQRTVQPGAADSASMYAVQTTSRSLPSQALLRKDVETLCSRIFSSAAHARVLSEVGDSMRGTHLLFIDSAETLLTHLCTQLDIDYMSGMAFTFAPLLIASGSEPLHPETVETLAATCRRFLPHIGKKMPLNSSSTGRRPLLKRMLLYHAPRLASHLHDHFPTWNHAIPGEYEGTKGSGAIPDSWLASFFESEGIVQEATNFDFLLRVWDCSMLLEAFSSNDDAPLTTSCFITLYAIINSEKALMRMEGEQLRHCMVMTLAETLLRGEATKNQVFVKGIRQLMEATPPCFTAKLRRAGVPPPPAAETDAAKSTDSTASETTAASNNGFGMNTLLAASTQGLKDVSNLMIDMPVKLMIDMPVKLLTMVPLNPMAALSSPTSNSLTDSPETQQLFYLHVQAMEVAAVSATLECREVIPSVFGGITGHETGSLRYFVIDCRGMEEMRGGQVPTAFHFDPDAVSDSAVLDQVLATLGPLKTAGVHICVMGHGYAHIAEELRQFQQKQGMASASPFSLSEGFLETYANDQSRVQSTIDFLLKHEFPRVSVLEGGYSAAHGHLFRSHSLTVDDLADHDTPSCKLCQHDRSMEAVHPAASGDVFNAPNAEDKKESMHEGDPGYSANARTASSRTSEASSHQSSIATDDSGFTDINLSPAAANTKSPPGGSYYSSFAGAFKTGSKTLLSPTMDGTKWLLKKSAATTAEFANAAASMGNMGNKNRTGSMQGAAAVGKTPISPAKDMNAKPAMPNLNKLRNSLVAIGSESLDILKKVESAMEHAVEQAAVATTTTTAKVRVPFPSTISPALKDAGAAAAPTTAKSPPASITGASTPPAPRASLSSDPAHCKFFHQSTEEMFTIDDDDDDDEGHFVQDEASNSRTSSSTSSFVRDSPVAGGGVGPIHEVVKDHVGDLKKGMSVSRTQMLPCVSSPFFACYKKKVPAGNGGGASHPSMHPRRVVVMENHLVVLKSATRNEDDLFIVKSCHPLSHITRMTCLKKNALMVSIYYKWKANDGQIVERRNSYEVQQRDDFIKAVKSTMDKM
ncbi:uncharacterized protein IUM83_00291 [Phytophthora cinnamomi]|uniref:uncharacterized protein n=1 Tax=Phytophthora cinnamomi TaxID=4785 RepID=UPI0035594E10|nr:hypothetical protein IUM83_00291 [Phytophthora cinnamomi]